MSTMAFAELEREVNLREQQIETSRDERAYMAEMEKRIADTNREIYGFIGDLREYFPTAKCMHDVYRAIEALQDKHTAMMDALRVTEGNVASLAATTPAVYGVWLEVVRAAIATGEAKS